MELTPRFLRVFLPLFISVRCSWLSQHHLPSPQYRRRQARCPRSIGSYHPTNRDLHCREQLHR